MPIKSLAQVLVNGHALAGESTSLAVKTAVEALEWQTLNQSDKNLLPDVPVSNISHSGYWSDADPAGLEKRLWDALAAADATIVSVLLGTQLALPVGYSFESAFSDSLETAVPSGELITVEGNWLSRSGERMLRGYPLAYGVLSATGAQSVVDFGGAGSAGGVAHLQVMSVVGAASNAQIQVQGSTVVGFSSPVTLGTFTFSGNATTGIQALGVSLGAGTVHRYLRANVVSLGGATSFGVMLLAGQRGRTY